MKKFIISLLILLMVAVPITAKDFSLESVTYPVLVNGQQIPADKPVLNFNGTTYVPLRSVLDIMGARTEWSGGKVNIDAKKWDAESLQSFLNTQCSALIIEADTPDGKISQGSGFVVLDGSYIITNAHVIYNDNVVQARNFAEDNYTDYTVVLKDDSKDIAILKGNGNYTPLILGDSSTVKANDGVIYITYPDYKLHTDAGAVVGLTKYKGLENCIESTTDVFPGSSGGALLNTNGEVIGVIAASDRKGHSCAIPINEVKSLLSTLN